MILNIGYIFPCCQISSFKSEENLQNKEVRMKKGESDFEVSRHPHFLTAAIRALVNGQERDPSRWR